MRLILADAKNRYGEILNGKWANESQWCATLPIPDDISANWINKATGKPTIHIYCNRDLAAPLLQALNNLKSRGLLGELQTFDGCFMIREVRGESSHLSCHSYALAIDVNAATNKLGDQPSLSPDFVKCFTDAGFLWGGDFKRRDGMHFQFAEKWLD